MNITTEHQKAPPRCDCREVGRTGCCRGGHRHGKHQAPARGPAYTRSHELPQVGHRHRRWRWDAIRALRAAVEARELSRGAHCTMHAVLEHSDGRGKDCWPSLETLGVELGGLSARTVGTYIAELKAKGWLAVKHRHRITPNGIQGRSNIYRPLLPADPAPASRQTPSTPARAERRHPTPEAPDGLDEVQPAAELVARWVAALAAMATAEVDTLAAKHLPALVAKRPGQARTRSLAVALANAEGPP